jgi:hypothetical protein
VLLQAETLVGMIGISYSLFKGNRTVIAESLHVNVNATLIPKMYRGSARRIGGVLVSAHPIFVLGCLVLA